MVFAQVQREAAPGDLHIGRRPLVEVMLPIEREAQIPQVEFLRLGNVKIRTIGMMVWNDGGMLGKLPQAAHSVSAATILPAAGERVEMPAMPNGYLPGLHAKCTIDPMPFDIEPPGPARYEIFEPLDPPLAGCFEACNASDAHCGLVSGQLLSGGPKAQRTQRSAGSHRHLQCVAPSWRSPARCLSPETTNRTC